MEKLKYSSLVLLGGISYGLLSTMIKLGFIDGFTIQQLVGGEYVFGWLGLLIIVLLFNRVKVTRKQIITLMAVGITLSSTSILYGFAVQELSASIAVVCLFQFTWIGVLIEAVADKKMPSPDKLLSIAVLFVGTLLAGGVFEGTLKQFSLIGIMFGLLAALSFALYIFASGKVETGVSPIMRSFLMATGAVIIISIFFRPTYLFDGSLQNGLLKYVLFLGFFGVVIPTICFAVGTPKVGTGLGTILGALELPTAIIASVALLHETVTGLQWLGIICIVIGIIMPQYVLLRRERALLPG